MIRHIKTFIEHPLNILSLITAFTTLVFILSLFLPLLFCLIPPFICAMLMIILIAHLLNNRDYHKIAREKEYEQNSLLIDELLNENNTCRRHLNELRDEKEFLISVVEQYDIKKIN